MLFDSLFIQDGEPFGFLHLLDCWLLNFEWSFSWCRRFHSVESSCILLEYGALTGYWLRIDITCTEELDDITLEKLRLWQINFWSILVWGCSLSSQLGEGLLHSDFSILNFKWFLRLSPTRCFSHWSVYRSCWVFFANLADEVIKVNIFSCSRVNCVEFSHVFFEFSFVFHNLFESFLLWCLLFSLHLFPNHHVLISHWTTFCWLIVGITLTSNGNLWTSGKYVLGV